MTETGKFLRELEQEKLSSLASRLLYLLEEGQSKPQENTAMAVKSADFGVNLETALPYKAESSDDKTVISGGNTEFGLVSEYFDRQCRRYDRGFELY